MTDGAPADALTSTCRATSDENQIARARVADIDRLVAWDDAAAAEAREWREVDAKKVGGSAVHM